MSNTDPVIEAMGTARSMRWLKPDPVDPDLVTRVIWAGTRASSPNNVQPWEFVVVTSAQAKRRIHEALLAGFGPIASALPDDQDPRLPSDPSERRTYQGARNLMANLPSVPVIVLVGAWNIYPADEPVAEMAYSAIFAAAQNMLVAARSLGLGAAFTTFHRAAEAQIRSFLNLPPDLILGVTMPLGWPDRPFGPVQRRPVEEVIHYECW